MSLYASRPCWQTAATVRTVSNRFVSGTTPAPFPGSTPRRPDLRNRVHRPCMCRRLQRGRLMGQAVGDSVGSSAGFTKLRRRFVQLSEQSGNPASNLRVLQFNTLADGLAQNGDFIAVRRPPFAIWLSRCQPSGLCTLLHRLMRLGQVCAVLWLMQIRQCYRCATVRDATSPSAPSQVPAEVLEWRNRAAPLLAEILEADADIIALQEVNHYGAVPLTPAASCLIQRLLGHQKTVQPRRQVQRNYAASVNAIPCCSASSPAGQLFIPVRFTDR